jgi:ribosomal protein S18 acetylase RimI-like enzyme
MLMLFERIRKENGGPVKLGLSYETYNKAAEKLYRSLGFEGSGEKLEDQIVVWKRLE